MDGNGDLPPAALCSAFVGTAVFAFAHLLLGPQVAATALCVSFLLFHAALVTKSIIGAVDTLNIEMEAINQNAPTVVSTAVCCWRMYWFCSASLPA